MRFICCTITVCFWGFFVAACDEDAGVRENLNRENTDAGIRENLNRENTIVINGYLEDVSLVEVRARVADGSLEYILVTSGGGYTASALDLAEAIQGEHVKLVMRGYCLGECMTILAPAAEEVLVLPDTLYALQGSAYHISQVDEEAAQNFAVNDLLRSNLERSIALYEDSGLPLSFLYDAGAKLRPTSGLIYLPDGTSGVRTHYGMWIPSPAYLRSTGLHISGHLIENQHRAGILVDRWVDVAQIHAEELFIFE